LSGSVNEARRCTYKDDVNLYAYVGNDPLDRTDPTGLTCGTTPPGGRVHCKNGQEISRE